MRFDKDWDKAPKFLKFVRHADIGLIFPIGYYGYMPSIVSHKIRSVRIIADNRTFNSWLIEE